ncbi:MAG: transposase [Planctomycetota bacterium]|jgi:REP element-mobilizing transposase RayT
MNPRGNDDAPDAIWHVTSRVNWRAWHLEAEAAYLAVLGHLSRVLVKFGVELLAFVVMSNHLHLVLRMPAEALFRQLTGRWTKCRHFRPWPAGHPKATVIGQFMKELKLSVSNTIQGSMGLTGHFWEKRHHRRRLWDPWGLVVAVAYDHRNPVREGMVLRPEQYGRSSAAWWATKENAPIALATRSDFPFGLDPGEFRSMLMGLQAERHFDDVMEAFVKSGRRIDSETGRALLERLMEEAGVDPLRCGSRAAVSGA